MVLRSSRQGAPGIRLMHPRTGTCTRLACIAALALATPAIAIPVSLYQRVEETMVNAAALANRFTGTELRLDVAAPAGRAIGSSFTWYGFHDGNGAGGQNG